MATKKAKTAKGKAPARTPSMKQAGRSKATPDKGGKPKTGKTLVLPRKGEKTKPSAAESVDAAPRVGIKVGDHAPSFVLHDDKGTLISSESLRGSPYVLYFYPKDDTPGCTLEACGFRDAMPRFDAKGVRVIGVSPDEPEVHARFKKKYGLPFALLSDPEKTLAKSYGVWVLKKNYGREYMGVERSTFYVDRRGTVQKVWRPVRVPGHVDVVIHSV